MRKNTILIVLFGFLILLAVTNPGLDEFNSWLETEINQAVKAEAKNDKFLTLVTSLGLDKALTNFIMPDVQQQDFIFFTIYEIQLSEKEVTQGESQKIVGIAKQFIPLSARN